MLGRFGRRLGSALVRMWRAGGAPFPKATWEAQYASGHWDDLASIDNLGPYVMVAGYVHRLHPRGSVLDVGCGAGILLQLLTRFGSARFVGVDISAEAIARAASLGIGNASFVVAAFDEWEPPERYDVIVFGESLFYARSPAEVLLRYSQALSPGGSLVVSMFRARYVPRIWRSLDKHFVTVHSMRIENDKGMRWDVKVLRRLPS